MGLFFMLQKHYNNIQKYGKSDYMFKLYCELSKATDFFNSVRAEQEQLEYYEVLNMIEDRYNEKEVMELIISLYSQSH